MKRKLYLPLIFVVLLTMGCSLFSIGQPQPTLQPMQEELPTLAPTVEAPTAVVEASPTAATVEESGAVASLRDAEKAVIRIVTQGSYEYAGYGSFEESFTGSGFIIDPSGLAVTNNHVVTGAALVEVYFSGDPTPYRAKVLGSSECSDLALIDIEGNGYPYFDWYTGDIELGLDVYSLGYPLGDPEFSQHNGAVSKKSAGIQTNWTGVENVLEHDALINPGSSGGPLVTKDAQVVGINYATLGDASQYYAITYQEAEPLLDAFKNGESVLAIGINGEAFVTDDGYSGIWVYSVASGSPADQAGIKAGDIIEEMEGITLAKDGTMADYCSMLRGHNEGSVLSVKVWRYKTGDVLEGQVNGRALTVTGNTGAAVTNDTTTTSSTDAAGDYFMDEFDGDTSNWFQWTAAGDNAKKFAEVVHGNLKFVMPSSETYAYVENEAYVYQDVYVEGLFRTVSGGLNGMTVICRSSDEGWYEFRVHTRGVNAGSYEVYRYDSYLKSKGQNPYVSLLPGGRVNSMDIVNGFSENTIGMSCAGKELRFWINGVEQTRHNKAVIDSTLSSGYTGVGVMSFSDGKVDVEVDYFGTNAP